MLSINGKRNLYFREVRARIHCMGYINDFMHKLKMHAPKPKQMVEKIVKRK